MENKGKNLILPLFILSAIIFGGGYYLNKVSVLSNLEFGTCEQYQGFADGLYVLGSATLFAAFIIFFRIVYSDYFGQVNDEE